MSISSSEEMCLTFQHSTHIAHEMYIKNEKLVDRNLRHKITPEGNRRDWTCRSHELNFNTVIYIVKMAHLVHLFNQDLMKLQIIELKVYSGSQNYIIFHILYFVEPLGTDQHLLTTMAWHRNRRQAISVSNGDPFYWRLQIKCNYCGSWARNIVHSRHLAVTFLQGLYHSSPIRSRYGCSLWA